ncbi:MAG: sodium:proton antiporter [Sulfolobales archaeon]|nr:sodium:proton antiporter [Sulfolobales archaeon]MCX8209187.1 sodium:proton antiporter [Sulfolobales archaeon]MDW8010047.1 sodium:proton antiporter [Sulfolobales archaeon]
MSDPVSLLLTVLVLSLVTNIGISLYGVFTRPSLVKKFISLTIFSDTLNSFAIALGFRRVARGYPSIAVIPSIPEDVSELRAAAGTAVDPLPQALVLTAIVIGLAVYMFLAGLIVMYYRHYGTTHVRPAEGGSIG